MALQLDPVPQVWGITGNLGGGKSLTAVTLASVALSRGFFIVSNISLNMDNLAAEYGEYVRKLYYHFSFEDENFDPFALPTGSPRGSGGNKRVLVIMDECAEWIDQYSSVNTNPRIKRFLSWLRHSSKRSQDVILVVQRLDYLNKNIRLLISKWVIVDDLRVWRAPVIKMRVPFMSGFVMQRVFDRNKKLIQGPCIVHKKSFGRFYNTAECLNADGAQYNTEYELVRPFKGRLVTLAFWFLTSLLVLVCCLLAYESREAAVIERIEKRTMPSFRNTARPAAHSARAVAPRKGALYAREHGGCRGACTPAPRPYKGFCGACARTGNRWTSTEPQTSAYALLSTAQAAPSYI